MTSKNQSADGPEGPVPLDAPPQRKLAEARPDLLFAATLLSVKRTWLVLALMLLAAGALSVGAGSEQPIRIAVSLLLGLLGIAAVSFILAVVVGVFEQNRADADLARAEAEWVSSALDTLFRIPATVPERTQQLEDVVADVAADRREHVRRSMETELKRRIQLSLRRASPRGELSEASLERLTRRWLQSGIEISTFCGDAITEARRNWDIANASLETLAQDAPLALARNELCVGQFRAHWWVIESRRLRGIITMRQSPQEGPRIARKDGVYWRKDRERGFEYRLRSINDGNLFLTTSRLVLVGGSRSRTIRLNQIVAAQVQADGLDLQLATGIAPFLAMESGSDELLRLLIRVAPHVSSDPPTH